MTKIKESNLYLTTEEIYLIWNVIHQEAVSMIKHSEETGINHLPSELKTLSVISGLKSKLNCVLPKDDKPIPMQCPEWREELEQNKLDAPEGCFTNPDAVSNDSNWSHLYKILNTLQRRYSKCQ